MRGYEAIIVVLEGKKKELDKKQSTVDRETSDVLHKIELSNFNACDGYTYAKMLKEISIKRRAIKNEYSIVMNAINELSKDVNDNTGKSYKVRELTSQFGSVIK